jgi:hypothetical protein
MAGRKSASIVKIPVTVWNGDWVIKGDYWPNGAGLSIAIDEGEMRVHVEGAVDILYFERASGVNSVELEWGRGWHVALGVNPNA